jgi:SAM-dependent methyltransferase
MLPELYHTHHNCHLEDIPMWLELAAHSGNPILELGCGTGRVLIQLARAGYDCVGLDRDLEMLRYLGASLETSLREKLLIVATDISCFNLEKQFALIILPCNTFSTMATEQRRGCLSRVTEHLKPAGIFAVSLPNPELWRRLPARSDVQYEEEFILPRTGNPVQVSSSWLRDRNTFTIKWIYDQLMPDGMVQRTTTQAVHFRIPVKTYLEEIQSAGMNVVSTYGDYDQTPYTDETPNLIILATNR